LKELDSRVRALASDMGDEEILAKASDLLETIGELLEVVTIKLNM
jgi:hypothetical protein